MSYLKLERTEPNVILEVEGRTQCLNKREGVWSQEDVTVRLENVETSLQVIVSADQTPVVRVWLVWEVDFEEELRVLGDSWERGYGDLEWRGLVPERIMPWYLLIAEKERTHGYGVKTGASAMCFWKLDRHHLRLCLDVRNGGSGVILKGRALTAASIVSREGVTGETPFASAKAFCRVMCENPRLPEYPVYGSNNWYYAYGESSAEQIKKDAELLAELTAGNEIRPYMVVDDGWQKMHAISCSGGPWDQGNYRFPDMKQLAADLRSMDLHPGLWFRPLATYECYPQECYLPNQEIAPILDPSHPYVQEKIEEMTRQLTEWGYELLKHDFSTYDLFGRWGFRMNEEMTTPNWHFYDRSKTTAEIILELYRTIRRGAGERTIIIGCNTVSHLAAGLFELQRTGDDTSGKDWERTRKMGINTLAFRMPQNNTFYACDADCAGITGKIDWTLNREWISLLSVSGTPMFISADPQVVTREQKEYLRNAYQTFLAVNKEAVPLDWMTTTCPERWETEQGERQFCFSVDAI